MQDVRFAGLHWRTRLATSELCAGCFAKLGSLLSCMLSRKHLTSCNMLTTGAMQLL
jgi:hypothetical protein